MAKSRPKLEEVFKLSGIPTHTFVRAREYDALKIALRTPGRGIILEGPSGIGKTTAVDNALRELAFSGVVKRLSARKAQDRAEIEGLASTQPSGIFVIDDFHCLPAETRRATADFMKTLADEERVGCKLVLVGINKAGETLISYAPDLHNRIETIRMDANPPEMIEELVSKGQLALNIEIEIASQIVAESRGSFYVAQMLCFETCMHCKITEATDRKMSVSTSFEVVRARVMNRLSGMFKKEVGRFVQGPKLHRAGRAPYLHILKWLAEANVSAISLDEEIGRHPEQRPSVQQVVDGGHLSNFMAEGSFSQLFHFQAENGVLSIEDPQFVFYLRNLNWNVVARDAGFFAIRFPTEYDFALSFAGSNREIARLVFDKLTEAQFTVFYDENEQHRILAEEIEDYLAPIYRSEADIVVCIMGKDYPRHIWTRFESDQFKERIGSGAVVPILLPDVSIGIFDKLDKIGHYRLDPMQVGTRVPQLVEMLGKKLRERRAPFDQAEATRTKDAPQA